MATMEEEKMELTDFMAQYPSIDVSNIQELISNKWEFAELSSHPKDLKPGPTGFFKHQDLIERLLRVYDRQILIHETGTGKSFLIGDIGEAARRLHSDRGIRGVIVIVKGKPQLVDIVRTLVCRSTKGHYLTNRILTSPTEKGMKSAAARSLKRWYQIVTYGVFAKHLLTLSNDSLRAMYSDYLIIMDEFHNTRIMDESVDIHAGDPLRQGQEITLQMWRLSHIPLRIKVVGLSASLIINSVNEATITLNLILPLNRQIGRDVNLNTITAEELSQYVRGYISYVRAPDTHVYEWKQGQTSDVELKTRDSGETYRSQLVIYPFKMSPKQTQSYANAYNRDKTTDSGKLRPGLRVNTRQASKGIYPDGSWGNEGFEKYFEEITDKYGGKESRTGRYKVKRTKEAKVMLEYYTGDRLAELSASAWHAIKICKEARGLVVIFDEHVDGSSLTYLAVAMDNMGFEYHDASRSLFVTKDRTGPPPYCGTAKVQPSREEDDELLPAAELEGEDPLPIPETERVVRPGFKRNGIGYVMITKHTKNAHLSNILEITTSHENRYAEYVKVVMISGRAKEGISFNNMTTYIQYSGVWTPTTEYQAKSRGFRTTSHDFMIQEMIQRLMAEGMNDRELEVARRKGAKKEILERLKEPMPRDMAEEWGYVIVDTYRFTAIPSDKITKENGKPYPSLDLSMHRYTEEKNRQFKGFMRKLKVNAIDCWIHHSRNVRPGDKDGSEECDYQKCDYKCLSPRPSPANMDFSTADVYYIDEAIERFRPYIEEYFRKNSTGTVQSIYTAIDPTRSRREIRVKYIQLTLYDMIIRRLAFTDRFGYSVYLREDNGVYYIVRDFPIEDASANNQSSSFYGSTYIINRTESIDKSLENLNVSNISNVIEALMQIDPNLSNYKEALDEAIKELDINVQILVLEKVVDIFFKAKKANESPSPFCKTAIATFSRVFYVLHEPKDKIEEVRKSLVKKKQSAEKEKIKRKDLTSINPSDYNIEANEKIIIHCFSSFIPARVGYNIITKIKKAEGTIRIYKPSEGRWRDAVKYESEVYNEYIQWRIDNLYKDMDAKYPKVYAVSADKKLRIRDVLGESKKDKDDLRGHHRGHACESYTRQKLAELLWLLAEDLGKKDQEKLWPENYTRDDLRSKEEMIREIELWAPTSGWSNSRIEFTYLWKISGSTKEVYCDIFWKTTKERNQVLYLR